MIRVRAMLATLGLALMGGAGLDRPVERADAGATPASVADGVPGLKLVLRLDAYRLDVYEGGERTRSYTVAVGKAGHRTPAGSYRISRVIWNPWWHPPDRKWARGKGPVPPGPRNPMGRVKMYFRNLYYIHGTPYRQSLGRPASHGCVRMANKDAIELARLVHRYGSPNVSRAEIDRLVDSPGRTRTIWLRRPVPLQIVYGAARVPERPTRLLGVAAGAER